jgi:hypothetical protein
MTVVALMQMMVFRKAPPVLHSVRGEDAAALAKRAFVVQGLEYGFPDKIGAVRHEFEVFRQRGIDLKGNDFFFHTRSRSGRIRRKVLLCNNTGLPPGTQAQPL